MDKRDTVIDVRAVGFSYNDRKILDNVSFHVDRADFVCILGSNGTGKSTLIKLMLGLIPIQSGEILINGRTPEHRKQGITYVSQRATAFNQSFPATVGEIVGLGAYGVKTPMNVKEALDKVGMGGLESKLIGKLSGGQQQRVLIAKALVSKPDIVFLDEPTTGIDYHAAGSICCLLADLNRDEKLTVVMVTHDFASTASHATKVLKLNKYGKLKVLRPDRMPSYGLETELESKLESKKEE